MSRKTLAVALLVATLFFSFSLVHALERLPTPRNFRVTGNMVIWSPVENAVGYLVGWGPVIKDSESDWTYDEYPPAEAHSVRLPASQTQYTLYDVPACGEWVVQVQALGDGVNYAEYGLNRGQYTTGERCPGRGARNVTRNASNAMREKPPVKTCTTLPGHIIVSSDSMSVQCQIVGFAGIGVPSIINAGPLAAVDVWGPLGVEAKVCFTSSGSITFLDATTSPRTQTTPEYYSRDGLTCTRISHPGTVILMPAMMVTDNAGQMDDAMMNKDPLLIPDSMDGMVYLENCQVIPLYNLNFRDVPAGEKIGVIANGVTRIALARTANWFKVEHDDVEGWITAHHVDSNGNCG